ncbi:hypothetical protein DPEC_G00051880 [Dallia pectoralis]|uniref:Uncharacterized protein n=1 Tax=Dallia pectoralis TaxID=75939 RepID=A0ACC2HBD2_DALPE|nr:hypothetical protein DPEC_G00051880 [Dallia pectoralis]
MGLDQGNVVNGVISSICAVDQPFVNDAETILSIKGRSESYAGRTSKSELVFSAELEFIGRVRARVRVFCILLASKPHATGDIESLLIFQEKAQCHPLLTL